LKTKPSKRQAEGLTSSKKLKKVCQTKSDPKENWETFAKGKHTIKGARESLPDKMPCGDQGCSRKFAGKKKLSKEETTHHYAKQVRESTCNEPTRRVPHLQGIPPSTGTPASECTSQ
jgi:hypothetical protein